MAIEETGIPSVIAAQIELGEAKVRVQDAIGHLNGAMGLGLLGAGGQHAPRAAQILQDALAEIDLAIKHHSGSN